MYSYSISDMIGKVKYDSFHLMLEDKGTGEGDGHASPSFVINSQTSVSPGVGNSKPRDHIAQIGISGQLVSSSGSKEKFKRTLPTGMTKLREMNRKIEMVYLVAVSKQ